MVNCQRTPQHPAPQHPVSSLNTLSPLSSTRQLECTAPMERMLSLLLACKGLVGCHPYRAAPLNSASRGLTPSEPDLWAPCHSRAACCLYFFSRLLGPSVRRAGLPFFVQCLARNSTQKIFAECWEKRRNKSLGKMGGGSLRPRECHRFTQNRAILSLQTSFCCLVAFDIIC